MRARESLTVRQMRRLDRLAIEKVGIPSLVLMENAGDQVARVLERLLARKSNPRVLIFCGLGNNAGDGFVIARRLLQKGMKVGVFLVGRTAQLKEDAARNYRIYKRSGGVVCTARRVDADVRRQMARADMLVDALFGTGLNRMIGPPFKEFIEAMNAAGRCIVSVDIPSGLDGTTGRVWGACVKAFRTVTFACAKKGFFAGDGPRLTGRVIVVDIGIPRGLIKKCLGARSGDG